MLKGRCHGHMADTRLEFKVIKDDGRRLLVEVSGGRGGPRRIYVPARALDVVFTKKGVEAYPDVDRSTRVVASA